MQKNARFILSRKALLAQFSAVEKVSDYVSYSFKTNPDVGKLLEKETKCQISMSSFKYLPLVRDKSKVWFFSQAWDAPEISKLFSAGVRKFVVDNRIDLDELLSALKDKNVKIDLLLRMKMKENTIHTGKHFVFGMRASEINEVIPILKKNPKIRNVGIHFHRKTQNTSEWSIKEELEDSLSDETFSVLDLMDIGGGIPIEYFNSSCNIPAIFEKIALLRSWLNSKGVKMIVEPGRFLAAPAVKLEANIKRIIDNNIIIDCSVYNCAMDTFIMGVRLFVEGETEEKTGRAYTIKGCTPDSVDIFRYKVFLKEPREGQKIVFRNAGAYNFSADFDGLKKLKTVIVD